MFKLPVLSAFAFIMLLSSSALSVSNKVKDTSIGAEDSNRPRIGIVLQPYTARRGVDEISIAPDLLYPEVVRLLEETQVQLAGKERVELTSEEKKQYGVWHRLGLADAHLGRAVSPWSGMGYFRWVSWATATAHWECWPAFSTPGQA